MKITLCWKVSKMVKKNIWQGFSLDVQKFLIMSLNIILRCSTLCWDGSQTKTDCFISFLFCLSIAFPFTRKSLTLYVIYKSLRICWYFIRITAFEYKGHSQRITMANSRNMEEPKELFSWKEGERNFWSTNAVSIVILTGGQKSSWFEKS